MLVVATALVWGAFAAAETTIAIGIISPETGPSGATGIQHRKSIEWALHDIGYSIDNGGRHVTLRPVFVDDHGDAAESVRLATSLVHDENVVAILGPANSDCASRVLEAELGTPVISSLSSAPTLTAQRNPYFFRATIDDGERMQRFVGFLQQGNRLRDPVLLFYENNEYGRGLSTALTEKLPNGPTQSTVWTNALSDPAAVVAALPVGKLNLFLLGNESTALDVARRLNDRLTSAGRSAQEVQFLFVGDGEQLQREAPAGSLMIGEPVPDEETSTLLDAPAMVRPFVGTERQVLLTAYETARFVVPRALKYALAGDVDPSDVRTIRERLKAALETKSFDSLSPPRKIRFAGGNLVDPPRTPIYKVDRQLRVLDAAPPTPWLSVVMPETSRFLEEPVTVLLERHGPGQPEPVKLEMLDEDDEIVEATSVTLGENGKTVYTFHPRRPGHFRLWSSEVITPNEPTVTVEYPIDYGLALLGALVGVMLAARSISVSPSRVLQGMAVGAVLFGLSSYGRAIPLLASLPLPSLSPSRAVNAFFSGIIGGWGGFEGLLAILQMIPGWPKVGGLSEKSGASTNEVVVAGSRS